MDLFCKKKNKTLSINDSIDAIVNFKIDNIDFNILELFLTATGFAINVQLDETIDVWHCS